MANAESKRRSRVVGTPCSIRKQRIREKCQRLKASDFKPKNEDTEATSLQNFTADSDFETIEVVRCPDTEDSDRISVGDILFENNSPRPLDFNSTQDPRNLGKCLKDVTWDISPIRDTGINIEKSGDGSVKNAAKTETTFKQASESSSLPICSTQKVKVSRKNCISSNLEEEKKDESSKTPLSLQMNKESSGLPICSTQRVKISRKNCIASNLEEEEKKDESTKTPLSLQMNKKNQNNSSSHKTMEPSPSNSQHRRNSHGDCDDPGVDDDLCDYQMLPNESWPVPTVGKAGLIDLRKIVDGLPKKILHLPRASSHNPKKKL